MLTLNYEPLDTDLTMKEMAMWDTKTNILENFRLIHCQVAKSYTKDVLSTILDDIFEHDTALFANVIPQDELPILSELLNIPREHFVEAKRNDYKHLTIQKLHLVVTYQSPTTWRIYMSDTIRKKLNAGLEESIASHPEFQEFNQLIDQANSLRKEINMFLMSKVYLPGFFSYTGVPSELLPAKQDKRDLRATASRYAEQLKALKQGFRKSEKKIPTLNHENMQRIYADLDQLLKEVERVK